MAISFTTLQIFDQYLTTYRNNSNDSNKKVKSSSRYDTHNDKELSSVYSNIQWKNRFAPLYMKEPSPQSLAFAVHLKESANTLTQTISSLSGDDNNEPFSQKNVYSDNDELASVEYISENADKTAPENFSLEVDTFATPQINTSKYLVADKPVNLSVDTYSFDILTNKLHYELQFNVNENETNNSLQNKLARLINSSDIGIHAAVKEKGERSALELTSDSLGLPFQGEQHFTITEDNTSYSTGIVDYLGLNKTISNATNATYSINGEPESAYSNTFNVFGAYNVTLHPENKNNYGQTANIGLYSESESLSHNIEAFVDEYNSFLGNVLLPEMNDNGTSAATSDTANRLLTNDMKKFLKYHKNSLAQYGISINDNASLEYNKTSEISDPSALKNFGRQVLRKLNTISLDPMEYVERRICAYSNPATNYINPYTTSAYTGMLFNAHV